MLYPVYVHLGDTQHAHGATLPDFPGCFAAADNWQDLPQKVQESVELYFEGENLDIPAPSALESLVKQAEYQDGIWLLVDIDLSRVDSRSVRLNISLPANLVAHIDAYAQQHHMSRSRFLAMAARKAMAD